MKDMAEVFRNTEAAWITVGFWSFGYIADGVFFSCRMQMGNPMIFIWILSLMK